MESTYDEPVYSISVVAKIISIHPQTLRQYEKEGLIEPSRTGGKTRLYSQRDIDKIKTIIKLTRDLGVNLAGVDIILRLKERMDELDSINKDLHKDLQSETQTSRTQNSTSGTGSDLTDLAIIGSSSYEIILLKKNVKK